MLLVIIGGGYAHWRERLTAAKLVGWLNLHSAERQACGRVLMAALAPPGSDTPCSCALYRLLRLAGRFLICGLALLLTGALLLWGFFFVGLLAAAGIVDGLMAWPILRWRQRRRVDLVRSCLLEALGAVGDASFAPLLSLEFCRRGVTGYAAERALCGVLPEAPRQERCSLGFAPESAGSALLRHAARPERTQDAEPMRPEGAPP